MAAEQKQDTVTFFNVQKSYPPGEKLNIGYTLNSELKRSTRDWVGLFKVGWTSSRDYYTFEWAPLQDDDNSKGEVTFAGRRLPPEDNHFYQFCYVTSDGRVRGASSPFQFLAVSLARVDDLELVEVGEESLLILQPKVKEDQEVIELNSVNQSLKCEKEELTKQLETVERDSAARLKERDEQIADLERQLVTKRDSEQRLIEKLDKERALVHELNTAKQESEQSFSEKLERERALNNELNAAKTDTESQVSILHQQLAERDAELKLGRDQIVALQAEVGDLKGQLQIKNAQVEDLSQLASTRGEEKEQLVKETEQLQGRLLEVQQIRADLIDDGEVKQAENDQLREQMEVKDKEIEQLNGELEQVKQELACSQENMAELVGAGPNAVIFNQPTATAPDEPPTQPPTQSSIVDKAAYDALRHAYETLEDDLHKAREENKEQAMKLREFQIKVDEMVARLQRGRDEYEGLVKENHALKKRGHSPLPPSDKPLDRQIREMESINKELVASCEVASQQLSARKEEMKQQQTRMEELEGQLAQIKLEFEEFQDKHDKVVHSKTESLDKQQAVLDEKLHELVECQQALQTVRREKEKLEGTVHQLRAQLSTLKEAATTADRSKTCPVCQTKFPGRMAQEDFERHVQGHFN